MKTFMSDLKKAASKATGDSDDIVDVSAAKKKTAPTKSNDRPDIIDYKSEIENCLVKMKCELFGGEEIGIVFGRCRFKPNKSGAGGRITFANGKKITYDGPIFKSSELATMFEQDFDKEVYITTIKAKKTFGSRTTILTQEEAESVQGQG